ncbi:unnamed protein product [Hymenolepis diminuta]|uniref:Uncharacterized protein n=1 Tax=Hymenolepis diminuta TaxID=6216 RepID=A0A564YH80_HYMDI|nr:unnamed protein product [Hymenolepis diminuta]
MALATVVLTSPRKYNRNNVAQITTRKYKLPIDEHGTRNLTSTPPLNPGCPHTALTPTSLSPIPVSNPSSSIAQ